MQPETLAALEKFEQWAIEFLAAPNPREAKESLCEVLALIEQLREMRREKQAWAK